MNFKLFEFFNTTNQTSPHYERHMNFAKPVVPHHCDKVTLLEHSKRCEFVTNSESCKEIKFTFHYLSFFYCFCEDNILSRYLCLGLMIVFCIFLFWMVYIVSDLFLVPALTEILKLLNLTEYLAGMTVMTLSNSAPDALLLFKGSKHLYTDCVSKCIFASVFTSSMVMWVAPFAIDGTIFLRDIGFVLLFTCYIDFTIKFNEGIIGPITVLSITIIFVIYIVVVIIDEYLQILRQKELKKMHNTRPEDQSILENDAFPFADLSPIWDIKSARTFHSPNTDLFKQFFKVFDLLDKPMFRNKWTFLKLWALIKMPPMVIFHLFIPQMNLIDSHSGWSKLLCCIQIPLTPSITVLMSIYKYSNSPETSKWSLLITLIVLICCLPISLWAFRNSRTDMVPKWYKYVTILTTVSSLIMLSIVGAEVIALLKTLGTILNLSDTFVSCTLYSWGLNMADLIVNLTMARKGYPRMAYATCFGVTIFSIFFVLCLPVFYLVLKSDSGYIEFTEGTIGETLSTMMTISLFTILIYGCTTNFMLRRSGAIIGITLYLYSLVLIISSEFEFIHSFGTDHVLDRSHFDRNYGN